MIDNKIVEAIKNSLIELNREFIKNHELKMPSESKVRIGRSNSLSHVFERSIATNLSKIFQDYYFFVDYPIILYDSNGTKITTTYPDILIVKDLNIGEKDSVGEVVAILDLKIDLGYLNLDHYGISKDGRQIENENSNFIERESSFELCDLCSFNYIVGAYSKEEKLKNKKLKAKIPKNILKISITSTKANDHGRSEVYKSILEKQGYLVLFLLNKNIHPNKKTKLSDEIIEDQLPKEEIIKAFEEL